jgi:hypothetical protein
MANNGTEEIWKEEVWAQLKVIFRHLRLYLYSYMPWWGRQGKL